MESISSKNLFEKYQLVKDGPDIQSELELIAVEMMNHFGKRDKAQIWKVMRDPIYRPEIIRDSWFAYQKTGKRSFPYFIAILRNKAGIKKNDKST